jgi:small GTP-binding protein
MSNENNSGFKNIFKLDFLDRLRGLVPTEKIEAIRAKLNEKLSYEPRIGVFGKTGTGKSSLCNALFGQEICPINDVVGCTRKPKEVLLKMGGKGMKLVDVPGVGENEARDKEYAELYTKLLPELDLVLWVMKADDRAASIEQKFYKDIVKPHIDQGKPFFFVSNQVDKIEPFREWDFSKNSPGSKQLENIQKKIHAVSEDFGCPESWVIPVSANERYNLGFLVERFFFALPRDKVYTVGRQVKEENVSKVAQEHIKKSWWDTVKEAASDVWEKIVDWFKDLFGI